MFISCPQILGHGLPYARVVHLVSLDRLSSISTRTLTAQLVVNVSDGVLLVKQLHIKVVVNKFTRL